MSALLTIHIAAGALALVCGAVALLVKKGGPSHRRSGLLFVGAMVVMGGTASVLGSSVGSGLMALYFVGTALTTVRPVSGWTRGFDVIALVVALVLALGLTELGVLALESPRGVLDGVPFAMYFFLAIIFVLAASGDVRVLRSGVPPGGRRLARHLWRMCFALFIAAGSFFSVRERVAKVLPEALATAPVRALPILLLFGAMFYWLWRVRSRRPLVVLLRSEATLPPGRNVS